MCFQQKCCQQTLQSFFGGESDLDDLMIIQVHPWVEPI